MLFPKKSRGIFVLSLSESVSLHGEQRIGSKESARSKSSWLLKIETRMLTPIQMEINKRSALGSSVTGDVDWLKAEKQI